MFERGGMSSETSEADLQERSSSGASLPKPDSSMALAKPRASCEARTKAGEPCPMVPLVGTKLCYMHTPGLASKAGRRGGSRRAVYDTEELRKFENVPATAAEMREVIAQSVMDVREGRLDPRVMNGITQGATSFCNLLEMDVFAARLKELAERIGIEPEETVFEQEPVRSPQGRFMEQ